MKSTGLRYGGPTGQPEKVVRHLPHEERIEHVLGVVYRREGMVEFPDNRTPLSDLLQREDGELSKDVFTQDPAVMQEAFSRLLNYFFADGPHPGCVLRRVFAVAWALRPSLITHMRQTDIALMFGETKAAMSWRINQIFTGYLKAAGMRGTRVPGQKSQASISNYSAAQMGNQNRAKTKRPTENSKGKKQP